MGGLESVGTTPGEGMIFLGFLEHGGRTVAVEGPYVEDERGYSTHSPCWAWQGPFSKGRPYVKTRMKTRSVLKMIASQRGARGRVYQRCGHSDCVNPSHLASSHYWKYQERDPETKRFA